MSTSSLRRCPQCQQAWPKGDAHDLRRFAWLDPLPRRISISNGDLIIHDGAHGPDRFLVIEAKMPWERVIQAGQAWLLRAIAALPGTVVVVLHGPLSRMTMQRVSRDRIADPAPITPDAFRSSVVDWLNGQAWRDPRPVARRDEVAEVPRYEHLCEWMKQTDGSFVCVGCGDVWRAA